MFNLTLYLKRMYFGFKGTALSYAILMAVNVDTITSGVFSRTPVLRLAFAIHIGGSV